MASHIKLNDALEFYREDPQLQRNTVNLAQNKALIDHERISINAIKLLSKICLLWTHLPAQKQLKLYELFQEVSDQKGRHTLINLTHLHLLIKLEDFYQDPLSAIQSLEFLTVCIHTQPAFLAILSKKHQRIQQFDALLNERLKRFVQNAIAYCSENIPDELQKQMMKLFYAKLVIFVTEAAKHELFFTQNFLKSDYFPQMLVTAFDLLEPQSSQLQNQLDEPKLQEHVELEMLQFKSKEFQKQLS